MNKDIIQGHWKEAIGKVTQQWGELTNDDVTQLKGTYKELEGLLQERYGYAKDKADQEIDAFIERNHWH